VTESIEFNPLSQSSYFVVPRFDNTCLSSATAFFVIRNGKLFLITNWHVVSGRSAETEECLSATCAIPNNLFIRLHKNSEYIEFEDYEVRLLDETGSPLWLEHPVHGKSVDVIAIPLSLPSHLLAMDVEKFIEPMNEGTEESVTDDVFILGYPFGLAVGDVFPIWKRATIASEPAVDVSGRPMIFVDTASRSGMSGSPVVLLQKRSITLSRPSPANPELEERSRHKMKLIGVYSGRIGADDTSAKAQLGIVWKARVIDEIVDGGSRAAA
jgi:hypothetical protein